jgi:hypothetical protein
MRASKFASEIYSLLDRSFLELGVMSSKEYLKIELKGGKGQKISVCHCQLYKPKSDRRFQVEF